MTTEEAVLQRLDERSILGLTVRGEAEGEPIEGQIGVASVVRTRVKTGRWGKSYRDVMFAPKQFSCWNKSDPNYAKLLRHARVLSQYAYIADPMMRQCVCIATAIITEQFLDNVRGATHYCTVRLFDTAPPSWAIGKRPIAVIGRHAFFANIA